MAPPRGKKPKTAEESREDMLADQQLARITNTVGPLLEGLNGMFHPAWQADLTQH